MTNGTTDKLYRDLGYRNRGTYLRHLARKFRVRLQDVYMAAYMLGPNEDFDGLVTTLEDMKARGY